MKIDLRFPARPPTEPAAGKAGALREPATPAGPSGAGSSGGSRVAGDSFERVAQSPPGGLFGAASGSSLRGRASEIGSLLARGDAAALAAAWTDGNTHDPGITTLEALAYALHDFAADVTSDHARVLSRLDGGGPQLDRLRSNAAAIAAGGRFDATASPEGVAGRPHSGGDPGSLAVTLGELGAAKQGLRELLRGLADAGLPAGDGAAAALDPVVGGQHRLLEAMRDLAAVLASLTPAHHRPDED